MRTVLFICTGNTCRSPMAEAIARHTLRHPDGSLNPDVFVASAGIAATDDGPISEQTIKALKRIGIEHRGTSKPLSAEMIRKADIVLGMTDEHVQTAHAMVDDEAEHVDKITRLDPSGDIKDPVGRDQHAYYELAKNFLRLIPQRLEEMLAK